MEGGEIFKQKKNKRSSEVSSTMEGVYSGKWYMREGRRLKEWEEGSGKVWGKIKC